MRRDDRKNGKVQFPFPLSNGEIALFWLPIPLSAADAKRAGEFLKQVAVQPELAIGQPEIEP